MAAVMATTRGSLPAISIRVLPKERVKERPLKELTGSPVSMSKAPVPCHLAASFSAGT